MKITKTPNKQGLPKEFVILWRKNIRLILEELGVTQTELADRCGLRHSSISMMFNREDYHLTTMQAAAVLYYVGSFLDDAWHQYRASYIADYIDRQGWYTELTQYLGSYIRKKNTPDNEGQKP